ncbi:MAG: NAD-dependent epimerase/dehydratase family protein [Candidatus Saccharibacteria bacterium]|nr:NAD-dependent epimerase/dehydratase family protein [Rhodoferax sp.]
MPKVLVTGAADFVGSALIARLAYEGVATRVCLRRENAFIPNDVHVVRTGRLTADAGLSHSLEGIGVMVYAAARVSVMDESITNPLEAFLAVTCIDHPAAANQLSLVSDGEDLSTTDLLRRTGQALGKPARLLPVPTVLLKFGAAIVGRPELAQRLCGNLQVAISKTRQLLGWTPPLSVDAGLKRAAEGYMHEASV